jgi:hypothetical protein
VDCDHLRDWLGSDPTLPITSADLDAHVLGSPLKIGNAICNTHKHHTRRSGTTARIRDTVLGPEVARVTIEIDWATPHATTVDALQLAEECVASWRAFFAQHNIAEP